MWKEGRSCVLSQCVRLSFIFYFKVNINYDQSTRNYENNTEFDISLITKL